MQTGNDVRLVDVTGNPSWAWAAGEIISTTSDLNRFDIALLGGRLLRPAQLAQMRDTVAVEPGFNYGLGLYSLDLPCGRVWGDDGGIHGQVTVSFHSADGRRHLTLSVNPLSGSAFDQVVALVLTEFCGAGAAARAMGDGQRPVLLVSPHRWDPAALS